MSVIIENKTNEYLQNLVNLLLFKHYFSTPEKSKTYVDKIYDYCYSYIPILPAKRAPQRFKRYGWPLFYITYRPNKATSWYIFYMKSGHRYLVTYITNNHVNAQHILGLR